MSKKNNLLLFINKKGNVIFPERKCNHLIDL